MMKNWLLSLLLIIPLFVYGQDIPDTVPDKKSKEEILDLKEIVKSQSPISKRIFFIIDVSGSMANNKIKKALQFVRSICQSPLDEFEIAIVVFNDNEVRWEGFAIKDDPKPVPKGWAKMPSKEAAEAAQKFLDGYPGNGNTYPTGALEMALKENRSDMSIVYITDGDYTHPPSDEEVLKTIRNLQAEREKKGLGKAVISVFGVGTATNEGEDAKNLAVIGKEWLGGFYVEKPAKVEKKEETPVPSTSTPNVPTPDPTPDLTPDPAPDSSTPSPLPPKKD